MPNVIDLDLVRQGDAHLKRAKHLNPNVTTRPVEVAHIVNTQRQTFTVSELARLVGVHPQTVRRAIDAGQLKAAQSGDKGHHRISYAEAEAWWRGRGGGVLWGSVQTETAPPGNDTPEVEAVKARLRAPMDAPEVEARRAAAQELDALFAQLNTQVEEETGEPLPHYTSDDFTALVNATREEQETAQL